MTPRLGRAMPQGTNGGHGRNFFAAGERNGRAGGDSLGGKGTRPGSGGIADDSLLSAANTPVRNIGYTSSDWKLQSSGLGVGTFNWGASDEVFTLSKSDQRTADVRSPLPILAGRVCYAVAHSEPTPQSGVYFFSTERFIKYMPFCGDFGPFNLGMTVQFTQLMKENLLNPRLKNQKIVYYSSPDPASMTNAAYLLGAFMCLELNMTPEQAWIPFSSLSPSPFRPYRDATWAPSPFDLTVKDCWAGMLKSRAVGLFDPQTFDKDEYFYYDHPANGDMHEVVKGKFFAFKGPTGRRRALGFGRYSLIPSDYFDVWRSKNITTVVRLNTKEYDRNVVAQGGFKHIDLFFIDCSTPSDAIVDRFLRIAESEQGAIAIHCLAGLGRTGTLIALYMMKHYKYTARECMGWLRVCRPGSIIGPQQQFLVDIQQRMWDLGDKKLVGMGISRDPLPLQDESALTEGSDPTSAKLAEMVTKGMQNRDFTRVTSTQELFDAPSQGGHLRQSSSLLVGGQRGTPGKQSPGKTVNPALRTSHPTLSPTTSNPSPRATSGTRKATGLAQSTVTAKDVWGQMSSTSGVQKGMRASLGSSPTTSLSPPGSPARRRMGVR